MSLELNYMPSPNFDDRSPDISLEYIMLHYTGMKSGAEALKRLCDPAAKVSSHYLVEENGDIYQLVSDDSRAWHAGQSYWRGITDMNSASIGIEIVNPGHEWGYCPFASSQMKSVAALCGALKKKHGIKSHNFLAHSDVAPDRKQDPGELFDWKMLADEGMGFYPSDNGPAAEMDIEAALQEIGYNPDLSIDLLRTAFCRHFFPEALAEAGKHSEAALASRANQVAKIFKN